MATVTRLVLHRARGLGVVCFTGALLLAFIVGWMAGNFIQIMSAILRTRGGGHDPVRLRMAQAVQRQEGYYDDVLLHGRVT